MSHTVWMIWLRKLFGKPTPPAPSPEPAAVPLSISFPTWTDPKEKTADAFIEQCDGNLDKALFHAMPSYPDIVAELLERGATLDYRGVGGESPIHRCYGAVAKNEASLKLLLAAGADINVQNNRGETALHRRASDLQIDWVQCLIEHGADPNLPDAQGHTSLHAAAMQSHIHCSSPLDDCIGYFDAYEDPLAAETCKVLLDRGALIDARDKYGNTPFMWAARFLNLEVVKLLLARGANPILVNSESESAVQLAAEAYQLSIQDQDINNPFLVSYDQAELDAAREVVRQYIADAVSRYEQ